MTDTAALQAYVESYFVSLPELPRWAAAMSRP